MVDDSVWVSAIPSRQLTARTRTLKLLAYVDPEHPGMWLVPRELAKRCGVAAYDDAGDGE
jgi:hypothetical protein